MSGKPFSGKKTLAARLAEAYNLQVVDLEEVLHECLMLSKRPDASQPAINVLSFTTDAMDDHCKKHEDGGNPFVKQMQEIGYEIQDILDRGDALTDDIYVRLVTTKIRSLFSEHIPGNKGSEEPKIEEVEEKAEEEEEAPQAEPSAELEELPESGSADGSASEALEEPSADLTTAPGGPTDRRLSGAPGSTQDGSGGEDAPGEAEADESAEDDEGAAELGQEAAAEADEAQEPLEDATMLGADAESGAASAPEPFGWLLVGFPDNADRFQLLEKSLSGWVEESAKPIPEATKQKERAALIAPAPPQEPPPFELIVGGYDLHFRLDIHGDEVLRRAFGLHRDPATSLTYHLEDHPPSSKHQVIYERLTPINDIHNSMGTLTSRIHAFDISQPELDYMLGFFGPFRDCLRLTVVDANKTQDEVYDSIDEHVAGLIERRQEDRDRQLAEEAAAAEAAKAAEEPPADAEGAPGDESDSKDEVSADMRAQTPVELPPVTLEDLSKKVEDMEETLFKLILQQFQEMQGEFEKDSHELFVWHRAFLADFRSGFHGIQRRFLEFLQRPDDKQRHVDLFIQTFNAFSEEYPDMRKQDKTKEELHQRADDLQDKLVAEIDEDRQESLDHLDEIDKSGWVEAQVDVLAAQVQHAVQMEAKRYHAACQLMCDYYYAAMGAGLPPHKEMRVINVLGEEEKPEEVPDPKAKAKSKAKAKAKAAVQEEPQEVESKGNKKRKYVESKRDEATGEETPGHWEFPFLNELMEKAKQIIWPLEEFVAPASAEKLDDVETDPKAKAKGKAKAKAKANSPPPDATPAAAPQLSPFYVDYQQGLAMERLTFLHRLATIHNWGYRRLLSLSVSASEAFSQCRDWVLLRRAQQMAAVDGLIEILKEHIESDPPELITSRLVLDGAHLHRHRNVQLQPIPIPDPDPF